jgi:hypothetical protein
LRTIAYLFPGEKKNCGFLFFLYRNPQFRWQSAIGNTIDAFTDLYPAIDIPTAVAYP